MPDTGNKKTRLTESLLQEDVSTKRCRAKYHGQRCELPRRHRGYHHITVNENKDIEWADLWKLFWEKVRYA